MGGRGGSSGLSRSGSKTLTGTDKQVKYAKDILQAVNDEIDRVAKERIEKGENERFLKRIGQTESEFKKTVKESAELVKDYYEKKAYMYYGGNAGDIIGNRFSFKTSDVSGHMLSAEKDIRAGGNQDNSGIKRDIKRYKTGEFKYKK